MNRLIFFIFSFFRKKDKKSYGFSSYTMPTYNLDLKNIGYGLFMPIKSFKRKRKWFDLFRKKPKYEIKITNNENGSKNWEILKIN